MANTTVNGAADLFATIGSHAGRGGRIVTPTVGSIIDGSDSTDVDDGLSRFEKQDAVNYKVHAKDEAVARRVGV
ncbi:hypothetical protein PQR67_01265 [Paraburkholderia fungorum]|uniref:hypothetical protein n=1 Tax=Paraburkholderia fungorum TaxID=134537 RepID=UPI0038BB84F6